MLTILILALSLLKAQAAPFSAGPTTNPTIAHTIFFGIQPRINVSSVDNVEMRTLYDVVRSCLFTIAACVYRAIHQNIPDPAAGFWGRLRIRAKITFYAVIAPDAMIWWAIRQRYGAMRIANHVNDLNLGLNWTQTHGQFVQMGGFARKDNKEVLYSRTLLKLLRAGKLDLEQLQLTKEDIDDKSKGDILSKGLVAFQTTWFIFECLARLQQGLPLIELEVVTLAFATLNSITYALWWYKPLDVYRPIYLHIRQPPAESPAPPSDNVPTSDPPAVELVMDETPVPGLTGLTTEILDATDPSHPPASGASQPNVVETETSVDPGLGTRIRTAFRSTINDVKTELKKRTWWGLLLEWIIVRPLFAISIPLWQLICDTKVQDEATHVSTFYGKAIPTEKTYVALRFSCSIGIIFGAIHFISWSSTFPTHAELILWRISCIVLVIQPPLLWVWDISRKVGQEQDTVAAVLNIPITICVVLSGTVGLIAYILARFCILVLAFLTLTNLPPRALDNVSWTRYIPHL